METNYINFDTAKASLFFIDRLGVLLLALLFTIGTKLPAAALAKFFVKKNLVKEEGHYKNLDLFTAYRKRLFYFFVLVLTLIWFFICLFFYNNLSIWLQVLFLQLFFISGYYLYKKNRRVFLNSGDHKNLKDFNHSIDVVSQTFGKSPIKSVCVYSKVPTLFLQKENGEMVLKVTSSLLNLLDKNELTAVVACEYILLEVGVFDFRNRNQMASVLVWSSLFILVIAFFAGNFFEYENLFAFLDYEFFLIVYLLVLVYDFFEYYICFKEIYFCDIASIGLTRYPEALRSALLKIRSYKNEISGLPRWMQPYLFTAEVSGFHKYTPYQPDTNSRLKLIEEVYSLSNVAVGYEMDLKKSCPTCQKDMHKLSHVNAYNFTFSYSYCENCDRYWFDEHNLGSVGLENFEFRIKSLQAISDSSAENNQICPVCGIVLHRQRFVLGYPEVFTCRSCGGNSIRGDELEGLLKFRDKVA